MSPCSQRKQPEHTRPQPRAYLRSNAGDIPIEALDAQLLAEARIPVRPDWASGMGVPSELAAHVDGQLKARMSALIESGLVAVAGPGRVGLALDWEGRHGALRWEDLGVGVGGPAAGVGRHEGVLLDMGLLNESGERCLVLETGEGMVMIASPVTRLRVRGKFQLTRAHAHEHWAIRSR